jgi:hypothetical protein
MFSKQQGKPFKNFIMMTNKINFSLLSALSAMMLLIFAAGCDDLLNQTPRGQQTVENFFVDADDAIAATNATYSVQGIFNFGFQFQGMTDIASDDADKGSADNDGAFIRELDEFSFTESNAAFVATWRSYYDAIFRANQGITKIPEISDENIDPELRARLVGENQFLRAFYYFFLVRAYGGVPIIDQPQEPGEFDVPRSSADSVYMFIEQDLQDAIAVLPLKSEYPASEAGRATRGAAQGLLAKVHLFQGEFQEAEMMAQEVITSGEYSLLPDYRNIFTEIGENSSESLYEVQSVALETGVGGNAFALPQGVRGQPNLGFGFNHTSDDLVSTYDPGDPRLGATSLFIYELLPSEEAVVIDNANITGDERYNQKYTIPPSNPGGNGNSGANIRRLRYSDVVLMAAEAGFQNGNEGGARDLVNQVRQRARNGQEATMGIEVEPLSPLLADTTGLPAEQQDRPFIRFVAAAGTAADAGLGAFDVIIDIPGIVLNNLDVIQSIDGANVATTDQFLAEMRTKTPGQPVIVEVIRVTQTQNGDDISTDTETLQFTVPTEQLLPDVAASGQALLDAIYKERRIELAMEQQRFFDLRRTGRAGEVLRALDVAYEDGKHDLYPVPQEELDLGGYEQNPGYN